MAFDESPKIRGPDKAAYKAAVDLRFSIVYRPPLTQRASRGKTVNPSIILSRVEEPLGAPREIRFIGGGVVPFATSERSGFLRKGGES